MTWSDRVNIKISCLAHRETKSSSSGSWSIKPRFEEPRESKVNPKWSIKLWRHENIVLSRPLRSSPVWIRHLLTTETSARGKPSAKKDKKGTKYKFYLFYMGLESVTPYIEILNLTKSTLGSTPLPPCSDHQQSWPSKAAGHCLDPCLHQQTLPASCGAWKEWCHCSRIFQKWELAIARDINSCTPSSAPWQSMKRMGRKKIWTWLRVGMVRPKLARPTTQSKSKFKRTQAATNTGNRW